MKTWKRLLIITALTLAIYALSALTFRSFGQANPGVYQFGIPSVSTPSDSIKGVVLEKYFRNGSTWLTLVDGNKTYKVKVIDTLKLGEIKEGQKLYAFKAYRINSTEWKRRS